MGYRHYFYKLDKKVYNSIKDMTAEEFINIYSNFSYKDKEGNIIKGASLSMYLDKYGEEIFEFGKLYWDNIVNEINSHGSSFFTREDTNKEYRDYDAHIIDAAGFEEAINYIKEKINSIYSPFLKKPLEEYKENETITLKDYDDLSEEEKFEIIDNANDYAFYWFNNNNILNLKKNSNKVVNSYIYEHEIFNLVSEYNHFDFDNYVLVFLGW